ncbi:hypothetical protein JWG41_11300 [Leptospira sp. 201903075]|uniref:hypothetical protein n=1 Tax=Leptospira chreensis TaxID=2810035 RepID=UPI001966921B|nr:hypothetical protein [Leptospira chreensis]MBM9591036.1 hypothetical protein [Leptospira chreensis]
MNPIETEYKGYLFRSRLEARWAVFFDHFGFPFEYEKEGYNLDGRWYLPDFWLPNWDCWLEIKPDIPDLRGPEKEEYILCSKLAQKNKKNVILIGGNPWSNDESIGDYQMHNLEYGIALFTIPELVSEKFNFDTSIYKKNVINIVDQGIESSINETFYNDDDYLYGVLLRAKEQYPEIFPQGLPKKGDIKNMIESDKKYYLKKYGDHNPNWKYGIAEQKLGFSVINNNLLISSLPTHVKPDEQLLKAFKKARQERFERK